MDVISTMFLLSRLEEHVRVEPSELARPRDAAIGSVLERTLLDRIVHDLGLCVTLYDVLHVDRGIVYPNDGGVWFKVDFRVVVFRPFFGEILVAKIKKESSEGLQLTMGFFADIHVPEHFLPEPSFFDEQEGIWFWNYTNDEGETNQMYMEPNDDVRLKVISVKFNPTPSPEEIKRLRGCHICHIIKNGPPAESDGAFGTDGKPFAPMQVFGEIATTGLGPLTWWRGPDENDTADMEA